MKRLKKTSPSTIIPGIIHKSFIKLTKRKIYERFYSLFEEKCPICYSTFRSSKGDIHKLKGTQFYICDSCYQI